MISTDATSAALLYETQFRPDVGIDFATFVSLPIVSKFHLHNYRDHFLESFEQLPLKVAFFDVSLETSRQALKQHKDAVARHSPRITLKYFDIDNVVRQTLLPRSFSFPFFFY